ncbi:MAG: tRNA (N6-threonylcarbamoyladenosine(37)-N6)-methyltransferase TrmO, partial [Lachnospiraceae bacterium]|nr:tRNA (N6-threonylcarbamoyladenosine(37)-N6)-methyltransferase TrmO [Lachnospiraceae bacterium]
MELKVIAHIHTDMPEKFGLPRQSGLVRGLCGYIKFEPEYNDPEALRGIEGYEYLWLLWGFDVKENQTFKATVRPPRLGGNERMGVFATRSPFRPNRIGLSSVKLEGIEFTGEGPVICVSGIDMRDNTPIYDIKPYLSYTDSHEGARSGFSDEVNRDTLLIDFPTGMLDIIPADKQA